MNKSSLYAKITDLLVSGENGEAEALITNSRVGLGTAEYSECLGNLHFYRKEFQQAIPFYEAAMESSAEHDCARYHYLLGVQAEQAGRLGDAFRRYQAAIEIEPTFVDSYIELGGLLWKTEEYEGALQCYADALKIDPSDLAIHHNLVQVLSHLADKDPSAYTQALYESKTAYEVAKNILAKPDRNRVW